MENCTILWYFDQNNRDVSKNSHHSFFQKG